MATPKMYAILNVTFYQYFNDICFQTPSYDYYSYTPNEDMYNSDPYNRIAEIYDFEPNFKDANIVPHFKQYK